jgi:CHAT domain-containing protein/tetratricopeptide (TPR) repeat protein
VGEVPASNSYDAAALLDLVYASPAEAVARAHAILAGAPSARDASIAHQVLGLAERDWGDIEAALDQLYRARRLASQSADQVREAEVLASLGVALARSGHPRAGLGRLDEAVCMTSGAASARMRFLRGGAHWILGQNAAALADLRVAIPVLRSARLDIWAARAITIRGLVYLALGQLPRAVADLHLAERLYADTDQPYRAAVAVQNRGHVAFMAGDLPTALACLDDAQARLDALGTPAVELTVDRCTVLLAAGLAGDALRVADAGLAELRDQPARRAELALVAARAALAGGEPTAAGLRAATAEKLFARQARVWWQSQARLVRLEAGFATASTRDGRRRLAGLLTQARDAAQQLRQLGVPDAARADLLAGRIALALGRPADDSLQRAAQARRSGPPVTRIDGWLAEALRAQTADDTRLLLHACRRGLGVLHQHQLTLGSPELRARATARGAELAALAQRSCLLRGRTHDALRWTERWRATAFALPPVRPPDDPEARGELAALRETVSRLEQATTPVAALERDRVRLEHAVRARALRTPGPGTAAERTTFGLDVARLLRTLGDTTLIDIIESDGMLHVLVARGGRIRHHHAGSVATAAAHTERARLVLRGLAYTADRARVGKAQPHLDAVGHDLQTELLATAGDDLGTGPIVVIPPGHLQAVPWALIPALSAREFSVAPSITSWLTARATTAPRRGATVLVRGPGLAGDGREMDVLAQRYPGARRLSGDAATATNVLSALDGSSLAHIAAHGTFRSDNPLFSALRLDDGPITVYDLARLRRAPYRIVLSTCDSGRLESVGADELLGLTAALLPLGTAGVVASLLPVNDAATVGVMLTLHEALRAGATLAGGLLSARMAERDPLQHVTALSFVAMGAT